MAPRTLCAAALADAVAAVGATMVFAAPAALANLAATAGQVLEPVGAATPAAAARLDAMRGVRLLLSAGAPVPEPTLIELTSPAGLLPGAVAHTPYGMTECLPVTDISLPQMRAAGPGNGVCVGWPVPGVTVRISALDAAGVAVGELCADPGVTGEIVVQAPHAKARYDRLWVTQAASAHPAGWHRTGDVGHLDAEGRLWVEGRMVHIITTATGPVTPVGIERAVTDAMPNVARAAAVGVGPAGAQVLVVVVEDPTHRGGLAPAEVRDTVRELVGAALPGVPDIVAVLVVRALPTDIRHHSKIDRPRVASWAARVLAGGRVGRP
jgi:acyl-coenzyme A synthetase/AMP-(fatty) acid ligase